MTDNNNKSVSNNSPSEPVPLKREVGGMEYNFREIEKKWQQQWKESEVYKVPNDLSKQKYYVLDMFPYPSGAGLHVGHPLGYIASDIYARYKRLKGFNVLHPMGYDAFGLPAEQYAIEHGIHPAISTAQNIKNFRSQLDKIGFSFDWSREVNTSDPKYYKWTQWIFLQLFNSWYNRKTNKTEPIESLVEIFEQGGNKEHPIPNSQFQIPDFSEASFTAEGWKNFSEKSKQTILMEYRIAYCGYGEVNWCEALGTVLANDEVINGVSERGGYPVEKKKLRQWYLRITEYADRLLEGLQKVDFSEAMKEMQSNWIGKSSGAEIDFRLTPGPSPRGEGSGELSGKYFKTADKNNWQTLKEFGRENRKEASVAEDILWQRIRNNQLGVKVRRQHNIKGYIVDFALLEINLVIEIDGDYHDEKQQKLYDEGRSNFLNELGFSLIRFSNDEVINELEKVIEKIKDEIESQKQNKNSKGGSPLLREEKGPGDEAMLKVYTTRPDTIFGVDFMVIAPEHELIEQITAPEQKAAVEEYIVHAKSRSERERMAEKKISGVFTGAYAINPFDKREIPIWISEYVLAGYGTGAIMAVPCGDERDHKFAQHFNIPITNIIGDYYNGEEANPTKDAILQNSGFLNGMKMRDAIEVVINKLEELGIGKRKVNYKMRDAAFSRQRYWGEPFPIVWKDGIAYPLDEEELPLELPYVESYRPGPEGEGPLANIKEWALTPGPSPQVERGEGAALVPGVRETNTMPGYAGSSWYFLRYMDPHNDEEFCNKKFSDYWNQVDLYVGGTEHAVGHLLYSRMWTKALFDLGHISFDEPYRKLLNQGMIQGSSRFVYRINLSIAEILLGRILETEFPDYEFTQQLLLKDSYFDFRSEKKKILIEVKSQRFIKAEYEQLSAQFSNDYLYIFLSGEEILHELGQGKNALVSRLKFLLTNNANYCSDTYERPFFISQEKLENFESYHYEQLHVDVNIVDGVELDIEAFKRYRPEFANAEFILNEDGKYICGVEVEKMSKSKFNTVNPDDLVIKYGADTFRMYEMFLGPVEMSKPWDTKGIEGVHRFLKKLWRLFFDEQKGLIITTDTPTNAELKILHKTIKKIEEDTERFSYNTAVSAFMVCVNELMDLKCHKREILEPLTILLTPYAPHISEELYHQLRNSSPNGGGREGAFTILDAPFPKLEEKYLVETAKEYPISINGKLRTQLIMDLNADQKQVEEIVLQNPVVQKWLEGKSPKKIIYVKGKMVNVVI
jgi:leucyl-tRNA synthetase